MINLDFIFRPKAVAIVGASTKAGSVGESIIKNMTSGFTGAIYPVNPNYTEISGLKCYPSLSAIGQAVDLVIIIVPAAIVPDILEESGRLGIKGAIVISAGFKETGNFELENKIKEISARYDIALVGPNCLGVINPYLNLNASFASLMPEKGSVAFISQSGALCTAVLDCAHNMGIGFSKFISVGNKAVVDDAAILEYLAGDKETKVIAMYAEQLVNSEVLLPLVKKLGRGPQAKPIIVLKSGRTSAGAGASASHTGALAGNDAAYSALFRQGGVIRAESIEELFDYIKIFDNNPIAPARRLAIITNAGGPGVLAIDASVENNLQIAALSDNTKKNLAAALPAAANIHNPIDVLGDARADRYSSTLKNVLADNQVDAAVIILTPQATTEIVETAQAIVSAQKINNKPLAVSFVGKDLVAAGLAVLQANHIAVYDYPEAAVQAIAKLADFYEAGSQVNEEPIIFNDVDKEAVSKIFAQSRAQGIKTFPETTALQILKAYNFPILAGRVAHNISEAEQIGLEIGKPLALKIVSPDILHKTDAGGVMLNVSPEMAGKKFAEMMAKVALNKPEAKLEGILFEELITESGTELILGSIKDPGLGDTIMLGLGGIYVEVLKDVVFGLNPLFKSDVLDMIASLKSKKILDGARGFEPADKSAIVECVLRLAKLLQDFPEIKEMDINPLVVFKKGSGAKALDARIIIE